MDKMPHFVIDPLLKVLRQGDRIEERFEILSKPVRRSHSFAFKVQDLQTGVFRVLLFIPTPVRQDPEALKIVQENFQLVRMLEHPNIARFYDLHSDGKLAFIITEYVPGHTLKTIKSKRPSGKFSEEEVKWIASQILDALEYAHNQNILHRDLKPANITLTSEKKIKLIDFGISESIRQALTLVRDTSGLTSILYWSPEQVSGQRLSIRSDIYSLGATLYDLLNGNPPFITGDVYNCILHKAPEPVPDVSPQMNDLLLKALAKKPEDRFQTCAEMRQALQTTGFPRLHASRQTVRSAPKETPKAKKLKKQGWFSRSSLLKPNIRYPLISALLIVLIAVFLSRLKDFRHSAKPAPADSSGTEQVGQKAPLDSFQVKMVNALLSQVQEQIQRGHLVLPRGNNALTLLTQAMKIDSTNSGLRSLKASLKERILEKIQNLLRQNKNAQAKELIREALRFYPDEAKLRQWSERPLGERPNEQPLRIEILNGAGKKGIAKKLQLFLQKQGFQVVNTENYRVNGRVNWNVARSSLVAGTVSADSLNRLVALLGIPLKQAKPYKGQHPSATVGIVLGKDFRHLKPFAKKRIR